LSRADVEAANPTPDGDVAAASTNHAEQEDNEGTGSSNQTVTDMDISPVRQDSRTALVQDSRTALVQDSRTALVACEPPVPVVAPVGSLTPHSLSTASLHNGSTRGGVTCSPAPSNSSSLKDSVGETSKPAKQPATAAAAKVYSRFYAFYLCFLIKTCLHPFSASISAFIFYTIAFWLLQPN